jgi:hypothetical protein
MMDELREVHLGVARPDPRAPRASDRLRAVYETTLAGAASSELLRERSVRTRA